MLYLEIIVEDKLRVDAKTWCHSFGIDIPHLLIAPSNATWDILVKELIIVSLGFPIFYMGLMIPNHRSKKLREQ